MMWSAVDARSRPVISNPTDNENVPSFADVLMQSYCLRFFASAPTRMCCLSERFGGRGKISSTRDAALLREGPMSASPGRGAFLREPPASPCAPVWALQLPPTAQICIWVGQTGLRCECLWEPLLLCVCPAMTPGCRRWTAAASHYIIKQVFAHCKCVCSFRKLPWTIRKRELVLPQLYLYW